MKLSVQKRDLHGKKVKNLRAENIVPGTVFGPKREPVSIKVDAKELLKMFGKVGYNKFFDLEIEGQSKPSKVLFKEVNIHPLKDYVVDVSFYEVDEDRKVTVEVPIELIGESAAVKQKLGFLVQQLDTVRVYCLPKAVPGILQADITKLVTASDTVLVSDIAVEEGVEWDSSVDPHSAVAYIATAQKEIEEEPTATAEGEEGAETAESADATSAEAA